MLRTQPPAFSISTRRGSTVLRPPHWRGTLASDLMPTIWHLMSWHMRRKAHAAVGDRRAAVAILTPELTARNKADWRPPPPSNGPEPQPWPALCVRQCLRKNDQQCEVSARYIQTRPQCRSISANVNRRRRTRMWPPVGKMGSVRPLAAPDCSKKVMPPAES